MLKYYELVVVLSKKDEENTRMEYSVNEKSSRRKYIPKGKKLQTENTYIYTKYFYNFEEAKDFSKYLKDKMKIA